MNTSQKIRLEFLLWEMWGKIERGVCLILDIGCLLNCVKCELLKKVNFEFFCSWESGEKWRVKSA